MKNVIVFLYLSILFVVCPLLMVWCYDHLFNRDRWYLYFTVTPNCEYQVPKDYQLVYSKHFKRYVIQWVSSPDRYLTEGYRGTTIYYSSTKLPSMFKDSCSAKGYLEAYIQENAPKFK